MQKTAGNLIGRFQYTNKPLVLLIDDAYRVFAEEVCSLHENAEIRCFCDSAPENVGDIFRLSKNTTALVLAEPETYVKYKLYQYLDFEGGEPAVPGVDSRVLIFPAAAFFRMFSASVDEDFAVRDALISALKPNTRYRITTEAGTDITFESRAWIPLDFEICTAPVEESINGRIVVNGALFFKKIDDPLIFTITDGKISEIRAVSVAGEALAEEYRQMTVRDMTDPVNTQLAEIGVGFCNGAEISDCFMEAETVIDTCHFCFGNNICYGGINASEFHGASVLIRNPRFEIM